MRHSDHRSRSRTWRVRLGLVLGATLVTLVLAEVVVRFVFRGTVQSLLASRAGVASDGRRVLCLGDSYTFGLYYRAEESYPGRLQEMLRAVDGPDSWSVINAGVPAQNTAHILAALPALLDTWEPEVVLFLAGHNNRWNLDDPRSDGPLRRFWNGLVLVRLVRLAGTPMPAQTAKERIKGVSAEDIRVSTTGQETHIQIEKTLDRRTDEELIESVSGDLRQIVTLCQEAGASVVLLTYPSPEIGYEAPARAAREVAAEFESGLVDLREVFGEHLRQRPYHQLLIPGDRHPTERGHYWIARALVEEFVGQELVDAVPDWEQVPEALYEASLQRNAGSGLELSGPPRAEYQVLLAAADGPGQPFGARTIPLAEDDLFRASQQATALQGHFDESGQATVTVPADLADHARFAALVVYHDWKLAVPDLMVRDIAGPLSLD